MIQRAVTAEELRLLFLRRIRFYDILADSSRFSYDSLAVIENEHRRFPHRMRAFEVLRGFIRLSLRVYDIVVNVQLLQEPLNAKASRVL